MIKAKKPTLSPKTKRREKRGAVFSSGDSYAIFIKATIGGSSVVGSGSNLVNMFVTCCYSIGMVGLRIDIEEH